MFYKTKYRILLFAFALVFYAQNTNGQEVERRILVEKFGATWCAWCPVGDVMIDSLLDQNPEFLEVAIHINDALSFPAGDSLAAPYVNGTPGAAFNRKKFDFAYKVGVHFSDWDACFEANYGSIVPFSIHSENSYDPESSELSIEMDVVSHAQLSGDFRVNCYLVEKEFSDPAFQFGQQNGFDVYEGHPLFGLGSPIESYVFKNIVREMLGGTWGLSNVIPDNVVNGEVYSKTFTTQIPEGADPNNYFYVLMVQNYEEDINERSVINAYEGIINYEISSDTIVTDTMIVNEDSIDLAVSEIDGEMDFNQKAIRVFPNPSSDFINIDLANLRSLEEISIRNLNGALLKNIALEGEKDLVKLSLDLMESGLYLIEIKTVDARYFEKILVVK